MAGRPFIDWQLERLESCGILRVVLCIGHLGERIREHVGDGRTLGLVIDYSEDGPELRGTAGALRRALPLLDPEFLVTYGDSYLTFDYAALLGDLTVHPDALGSMSVYLNQGRYDASNTEVRGEWVVRYQKSDPDPALDHIDYGALALRREVVMSLPEERANEPRRPAGRARRSGAPAGVPSSGPVLRDRLRERPQGARRQARRRRVRAQRITTPARCSVLCRATRSLT